MQMVFNTGLYPGKSSVVFMPMIDLNPSDETCIYSTLHFVNDQAKRYNVTPVITFDQPLWWKALNILLEEPNESDLRKTVLRLGGFHTVMSFLGSIGHIMSDSGLQELLETVYAQNAVPHMLTGKAVSRGIRGHSLAYTALHSLLVGQVFQIDIFKNLGVLLLKSKMMIVLKMEPVEIQFLSVTVMKGRGHLQLQVRKHKMSNLMERSPMISMLEILI